MSNRASRTIILVSWVIVGCSGETLRNSKTFKDNIPNKWKRSEGFYHNESIYSIGVSPDGGTILTGGSDGVALIWAGGNKKPISLRGHKAEIWAVDFNRDGSLILTAGSDQTCRLWSPKTGNPVRTLRGHQGTIYSAAFVPNSEFLVTTGADGKIILWDQSSEKPVRKFDGHHKKINSMIFSITGKYFITGSDDKTAKVWNIHNEKPLHILRGHTGPVISVAISPNDSIIATGSKDFTVRLWDLKSGRLIRTLHGHQSNVFALDFHPDGKSLITSGSGQTLRLWHIPSGRPFKVFSDFSGVPWGKFSADGEVIIASDDSGKASVFRAKTGLKLFDQKLNKNRSRILCMRRVPHSGGVVAGYENGHAYYIPKFPVISKNSLRWAQNIEEDQKKTDAKLTGVVNDLLDECEVENPQRRFNAIEKIVALRKFSIHHVERDIIPRKIDSLLLRKMISQLASHDFRQREKSTQALQDLLANEYFSGYSGEIEKSLREVFQNSRTDPEIRVRVNTIFKNMGSTKVLTRRIRRIDSGRYILDWVKSLND